MTEPTEDTDAAELYLVDAILDVLSGGGKDDDYSEDWLLAVLIAWRSDVDAVPIPPMKRPTAA